jgi:hypothetical protein
MKPLNSTPRLLIGSEGGEHVLLVPTHRGFPDAIDYWDANWIYTDVRISVGAFRGNFEAQLRTDEFSRFRASLAPLYQALSGEATLDSLETWLKIHVVGDGHGHFVASCVARDIPGTGNTLTFSLAFDQTDLPAIIRGLDDILRAFPVKGEAGRAEPSA